MFKNIHVSDPYNLIIIATRNAKPNTLSNDNEQHLSSIY